MPVPIAKDQRLWTWVPAWSGFPPLTALGSFRKALGTKLGPFLFEGYRVMYSVTVLRDWLSLGSGEHADEQGSPTPEAVLSIQTLWAGCWVNCWLLQVNRASTVSTRLPNIPEDRENENTAGREGTHAACPHLCDLGQVSWPRGRTLGHH